MSSQKEQLVDKPWGYEIIWAVTAKYVGKILHINAGHSLSRQYHKVKEETIRVLSGNLQLEIGEGDQINLHSLKPGDVFHIPPLLVHRMSAPEGEGVDVLEVSTSELTDVVRLNDNYGRQ